MPLQRCQSNGQDGWKWGDSGHCYTGAGAKRKAIKQGIAIEGPAGFKKKVQKSKSHAEVLMEGVFNELKDRPLTEADIIAAYSKDSSKPYGDVEYADPGYQKDKQKRYPIDTEEHIRAAWNYINKAKNSGKYSSEQLSHIKSRIISAWKKKIDSKGPPSA